MLANKLTPSGFDFDGSVVVRAAVSAHRHELRAGPLAAAPLQSTLGAGSDGGSNPHSAPHQALPPSARAVVSRDQARDRAPSSTDTTRSGAASADCAAA